MCTVTIVRVERAGDWRSIRLACNRDESPRRPAALPPRTLALGAVQSVMPIDPQSGGTWVGVNERGLIATLLNRNLPRDETTLPSQPRPRQEGLRSRGEIVPRLLVAESLAAARELVKSIDAAHYPPFRAVVLDTATGFELRSDGDTLESVDFTLANAPLLFTSSGLGDHVVDPPRRALFQSMFVASASADLLETQEQFHRHFWPDRRHLSVCMSRDAARTVSYTVVDLVRERAEMAYRGAPPDDAAFPFVSAAIPCRST